jgi:dCMP deaminase
MNDSADEAAELPGADEPMARLAMICSATSLSERASPKASRATGHPSAIASTQPAGPGHREILFTRGPSHGSRTWSSGSVGLPNMSARDRASWDQYFMQIAREVATRATCDRKHVGAVIERDKNILATGYNGSIRGLGHCDEEGHMLEDGHCVRTIHAEANAIIQAAKNGARIESATIYVTASPCWGCFKMIANAGLVKIVYGEFYRDQRIFEFAQRLGIELVKVELGGTPA